MKTLNDYINESLLDDLDDLEKDSDNGITKALIEKFLKENYIIRGKHTIKDGVVVVEGNVIVKNKKMNNLTNDIFEFGIVIGTFCCADCRQLTSLKGAPKKVGGSFECSECSNLTSLEGAPEEVDRTFTCMSCSGLKSLEGAPKKVGHSFNCSHCNQLKSLKGAPEEVEEDFNCAYCQKITSLKGSPRIVKRNCICTDCPRLESLEGAPRFIGKNLYCVRCKRNFYNSVDINKLLIKTQINGNIYGYN